MANYNLDAWNDPSQLPVGYAGGLAFAMGIVGCVLGMAETCKRSVREGLLLAALTNTRVRWCHLTQVRRIRWRRGQPARFRLYDRYVSTGKILGAQVCWSVE
jgi:hypothetical protein